MIKTLKEKIRKLTLFDKLLVFLFFLAILFVGYLLFRKSTFITIIAKVGEENIVYEPWFQDTGTRSWFSQLFYVGMKETDGLGRMTAEVTSIRSYDTKPARKAVYLTLKIRAVYNRASNQYTYKGRAVLIGSPIRLNLDKLYVDGLVTNIEGVKDPRVRKVLTLEAMIREETPTYPETSGTRPYVADAIEKGDEIKDDQGNTVIRILSKRVEDAKRFVVTGDGRSFVSTNPLRKDVYLKMEVSAIELHGRYYLYDDVPLLVGDIIPIITETLFITPEVTSITPLP